MTVVIADDHAAVRKSLRIMMECDFGLKLIGEAADGLEAIRAVHALQPHLLLLDIKMPQMTGLEVLQYLRNEKNAVAIIILSNHSEPLYVEAAMRLGANAFVAKSSGPEVLLNAIHSVREGRPFVDPDIGSEAMRTRPKGSEVIGEQFS
jgi:two-component system nitrate/nitrite response regulator NarL